MTNRLTPDNIFFSLLKSGMYGTPIPAADLPEHIDWSSILTLAKKQTVIGLIIESVQFLPESLHPSPSTYAKMQKFALRNIHTHMMLDKEAARLTEFFDKHGIRGRLLKGQGVARYYRVPQMRQCGDIDYYVGQKAYQNAIRLCRKELMDKDSKWHETEKHFSFNLNNAEIELHKIATQTYSPIHNRRLQRWIISELEESEGRTLRIGDTDVPLPSYEFDAIFIFYHAWRHYLVGGIGLRQLCDWAMLFHSHADDIDMQKLTDNVRRFGMTKGWQLFASIAVRYLGVPADKIPLYDPSLAIPADKILDDIIKGGNFGFYSEEYLRTKQRPSVGLKTGISKFRNIIGYYTSIFPLIPAEATFLLFHRLIFGSISFTKRSLSRKHNN